MRTAGRDEMTVCCHSLPVAAEVERDCRRPCCLSPRRSRCMSPEAGEEGQFYEPNLAQGHCEQRERGESATSEPWGDGLEREVKERKGRAREDQPETGIYSSSSV